MDVWSFIFRNLCEQHTDNIHLNSLESPKIQPKMRRAFSVDNYQKLDSAAQNRTYPNGRPLSLVDTEVRINFLKN